MWLASALVLASAVVVVAARNLFRAALSLGVVFVGVAVLFLFLEAEFVAFVQILVYVGAILTLVVFAIMLTPHRTESRALVSRQPVPAAVASAALFACLARMIWSAPWPAQNSPQAVPLSRLGQELVTTLVLPFEIISLVFVAAIVGAIAMAHAARRRTSSRAPAA